MKKHLLVVFVMLAAFSTAKAEIIEIGSGTESNTGLPMPMNWKYTLSEQIYTVAEIGKSGTFSSIAFYAEESNHEQTRTLDLYLVHTDKSTFSDTKDWISFSQSDKVFSGQVTFSTHGWTTITFDRPFRYNGTSNLAVIVNDRSGSFINDPYNWGVFEANHQAHMERSDKAEFSPDQLSSYGGDLRNYKNRIRLERITKPINVVEINGFSTPNWNGVPDNDVTVPNGAPYSIEAVYWAYWLNILGVPLKDTDIFNNETRQYVQYLKLIPNEDYSFSDDVSILINGDPNIVGISFFVDGKLALYTKPYTVRNSSAIQTGAGYSDNCDHLPLKTNYNYSLTEQIYNASEIGTKGVITSISFFNASTTKTWTRNVDIYMKHTSKSQFSGGTDWVNLSAKERVFSGNVTFTPNGWTNIELDRPFDYDGRQNILVGVDDNTGTWVSDVMNCKSYPSSDSAFQAIYVINDNVNFDPSVADTYSGTIMISKNQIQLEVCLDNSIIRLVELENFTEPRWGEVNRTDLTVPEGANYHFISASWNKDDPNDPDRDNPAYSGLMQQSELFKEGVEYLLGISLSPNEGYGFAGDVKVYINGETSTVDEISHYYAGSFFGESLSIFTIPFYVDRPNFSHIDFETGNLAQASFEGSSEYPWVVTNEDAADGSYCMMSGNRGVSSSRSYIETTYSYEADGYIYFDAKCMGEGSNDMWGDKCIFYIDGEQQFSYGALDNAWIPYFFPVAAGTHTFKWEYTKDSTVNPEGDAFYVDNIRFLQSGRDDDLIDGISLTPAHSKDNGAWYSLDGRKVSKGKLHRGIYINNGKKVVMK